MAAADRHDWLMELNRLANANVYRTSPNIVDENLAANQYAGTSGYSLLGALNVKAGNAPGNYRSLLGVLNQLAGTTGYDRLEAVRRIVP